MNLTQLSSAGNPGENDPPLCWLSKTVTADTHSETALAMPAPCLSSSIHISIIVLHTVKSTAEIPLQWQIRRSTLYRQEAFVAATVTHVAMVNKHIPKLCVLSCAG
jgi:hypothetical protein